MLLGVDSAAILQTLLTHQRKSPSKMVNDLQEAAYFTTGLHVFYPVLQLHMGNRLSYVLAKLRWQVSVITE